ncbi:hypothetical protein UA08_07657 [Talaromyces atroroseus]|uniref:Major facilitator superfamily (MFS) profile domain-containing protein n=1 Tax=Talaromyces atroroseus TaxID=1441469 RepID=A0A225AH07_TALAT|nr:hypothetical protein UA08_07657 [Talaromyces atroroseus]OKL57414.1 hypothetical protein UA08_07657 [Talaromyces atroroseus]
MGHETIQVAKMEKDLGSTENDSNTRGGVIIDPAVEKSLVKRMDMILLPILSLVYLTHSLDRANLGNAKSGTLEQDLGLHGNQYSLLLMMFYIPYSLFGIPATILAKRYSSALVIPFLVLGWGSLAMITAATKNFGGIMATRVLLGTMEAGFLPCATFYLSTFYTRKELASRLSVFFQMGFISGAISGLISWSVFQWHRALRGWQYLFLIEGAISVGIAIIALVSLPRSVQSSRLFTDVQKHCASLRLEQNKEDFSWRTGFDVLQDWKIWMFAISALLYGVGSASTSNFLPVMIERLTDNSVRANLYTIGPNLTGALVMCITCWVSDRIQQRALVAIAVIIVSIIGWILLGSLDLVHHVKVGYFLTYLLTFGTFTPMLLIPAWVGANAQSASARAVALGFISMFTNLGGIVSSGVYRQQDAPTYRPALITVSVCQAVFIVICFGMRVVYSRMNRDLARGKTVVVDGGVEVKFGFRFML